MKQEISWLNDALSTKEIVREMAHYHVGEGYIKATDGRISAGHPWTPALDAAYLVPGPELNKVLARMPKEPEVEHGGQEIKVKCGRFRGTIQILPPDAAWFPDVPTEWEPIPAELVPTLRALRPHISDNAAQPWALCAALRDGWMYATTNVTLAAAPAPWTTGMDLLLPVYAVDFLLAREEGLVEWTWGKGYVAFQWESGSWMHALLMEGSFPEGAADLVREAWDADTLHPIQDDFRAAYDRVAGLCEAVYIEGNVVRGTFRHATVEEEFEAPWDSTESTCWTARYLNPVIAGAHAWDPTRWPNPAPFRNDRIVGLVVARSY